MTTTNTSPNGARAKILRALIAEGMLTTAELATNTGLRPDQARDNAVQARKDGLVTSERDDVTGLVAYKVTAKGRELCANKGHALPKEAAKEHPVDAAAKEPEGPSKCDCASTMLALDLAQNEIARHRDEAVRLSVELDEAVREVSRLRELVATTGTERDELRRQVLALESRPPSQTVTDYAVRHENGDIAFAGCASADAIDRATADAKALGRPVRVCGLVPIGTVEIRPVFVESES